ncbi:MAG: 7-carboxy-7-deazaguanine synthase [Sphingomonadales bacterium]|nr:7-carboxy-7-deazaguanine synthase [Sphingomonadales bacterium]
MTYSVKEIFYTLQGEGQQTGRAAVFLRFAGCNLWSGVERDRTSAQCQFCDTDFVGTDGSLGGKYKSAHELAETVLSLWPKNTNTKVAPLVVCTGGEPLLQLDTDLISALRSAGFEIAVESNGTITAPAGINWLTISPKANCPLKQTSGDELKLVYPQEENQPKDFEHLEFKNFFLQPKDDTNQQENIDKTIEFIKQNPVWRLSLQTHKVTGIR